MHPAALSIRELAKQCDELRTRRGGPGGQHRNKVETAVVLLHRPTGVRAEASERRSQAENRKVAIQRLRLKLALEHREPLSFRECASWQTRVRDRRLVISASHEDYPALVAEALDQLQRVGWQMAPAAEILGVTTSQLVKLFEKSPAAWAAITRLRAAVGLPTLR
jgi:hypothetical protein